MSTDGTQPPTIAPKRPTPAGGSFGARTATGPPSAGPSGPSAGPVTGSWAPGAASAAESVPGDRGGPVRPGTTRPAASAPAATTTRRTETDGMPAQAAAGPRRVRLAVARIDPWSVMKLSFLLSVAIGIMIVIAAAVVWYTLDGLAVFTTLNDTIQTIFGAQEGFDLLEYTAFDRTISLATMIAVVDIVLLTALSTIFAFIYNIVAALVGGIHLTLTDD